MTSSLFPRGLSAHGCPSFSCWTCKHLDWIHTQARLLWMTWEFTLQSLSNRKVWISSSVSLHALTDTCPYLNTHTCLHFEFSWGKLPGKYLWKMCSATKLYLSHLKSSWTINFPIFIFLITAKLDWRLFFSPKQGRQCLKPIQLRATNLNYSF